MSPDMNWISSWGENPILEYHASKADSSLRNQGKTDRQREALFLTFSLSHFLFFEFCPIYLFSFVGMLWSGIIGRNNP